MSMLWAINNFGQQIAAPSREAAEAKAAEMNDWFEAQGFEGAPALATRWEGTAAEHASDVVQFVTAKGRGDE